MRPTAVPAAVAAFAAATTMRPALVTLGPLTPRIAPDLGVGFAQIGLVTTMTLAFVALTSPFGPRAARRTGVRRAMVLVMSLVGVLGICRAIAPGLEPIVATSAAIGALVGLGQSLPPMEIRASGLPARIGSAAFTSGLVGSSIMATFLAVPLANLLDGWRSALIVLSVPALLAVPVWLATTPRPRARIGNSTTGLPWRDHTAWLLAIAFGLQAAVYQCLMAWLPTILVEDGWSEAMAGSCIALLNVLALVASLVLLFGGPRIPRGTGAVLAVAMWVLAAVAAITTGTVPLLAVVIAGASLGAILPLLVGLGIEHGPDARGAGSMAAFMFLIGFGIAALAPVTLGLARDMTGDFALALWLLTAVAVMLVVVAARLRVVQEGRRARA